MDGKIAVIGAGVIGSAVAYALACEGRRVVLIDRTEPGRGGASYGNAGHIAAELVQPLPSPQLLFGFWRELTAFGGPLAVPLRRLGAFAPWAWRFARAAFRREANTRHLAPLVRPAAADFECMLSEIGRSDLLRRNGHVQVWFGRDAQTKADTEAREMQHWDVPTVPLETDVLTAITTSAGRAGSAGLRFPDSAHVLDPLAVSQAFANAAVERGATFELTNVRALAPSRNDIDIHTDSGTQRYAAAVVCAGPWSAPLLAPFGLRAPLEAAHGYHVELPDHAALVDAPIVYVDEKLLVTPMRGRLRASSFMEFSGLGSTPDAGKAAVLQRKLRTLGYRDDHAGPAWRGGRPVLPDYLPGIGRAPGPTRLYYAIGHQHIGLTMAPVTARLVADLVGERTPRHDLAAFDLRRFGAPRGVRSS